MRFYVRLKCNNKIARKQKTSLTEHNTLIAVPAFTDLGLSAKVLSSVSEAGYVCPTPIQSAAIPPILKHSDILGIAQTGTGKTASFVLPILTMLERGRTRIRMPRILILAPTRELAAQIAENFSKYGKKHRLNIALLIGGVRFDEQERKLEHGADVVIATPGRMLDHYQRGKLLLTGVQVLVIDEADRMLDMGFIPDIERICKLLPMTRQTLFFSATMPHELESLAAQFLHNPQRVEVSAASATARTISQYLVKAKKTSWDKRRILRELIHDQGQDLKNAIIFCNRKRDVSELFRSLQRHNFNVGLLHGDMDQRNRMTMLENFRRDKIKFLVASDVAARGLDIPDVSHVFNFDVPIHAEDYVHRIGRTGRAGKEGRSFTITTSQDTKALEAIEHIIQESIPYLSDDAFPEFQEEKTVTEDLTAAGKEKPNNVRKNSRKADVRKPADKQENNNRAAKQKRSSAAAAESHKKAPNNKRNMKTEKEILGFGGDLPAFMRISTQ